MLWWPLLLRSCLTARAVAMSETLFFENLLLLASPACAEIQSDLRLTVRRLNMMTRSYKVLSPELKYPCRTVVIAGS